MIFITVGSTKFDKLVEKMDSLVAEGVVREDVIAQIGYGDYVPKALNHVAYVQDIQSMFVKADLVICHGGTGTVFPLLELGKRIIAVPNVSLQDDHQSDLLRALERNGWCNVCWKMEDLGDMIGRARQTEEYSLDKPLADSIWGSILGSRMRRRASDGSGGTACDFADTPVTQADRAGAMRKQQCDASSAPRGGQGGKRGRRSTDLDRHARKEAEASYWDHEAAGTDTARKVAGRVYSGGVSNLLRGQELRAVEKGRGRRVLIVGCGTSVSTTKEILKSGAEVWCLDISAESIRQVRNDLAGCENVENAHAVVGDAEAMPFDDDQFDMILGRAIVHHLDLRVFMEEVKRVGRDGAALIFSEPLGVNPLINMFRLLTPHARVCTEHPLLPNDIVLIKSHCTELSGRHNYLMALFAMPFFLVGLRRIGKFLLTIGTEIDRRLFKICPASRWLAWNVLLSGRLEKR